MMVSRIHYQIWSFQNQYHNDGGINRGAPEAWSSFLSVSLFIMLSEICTEQIYENFWFASYGNFNVIMNKNDGYINATKLCSLVNKKFSDWKCNANSLRLMHELEDEIHAALDFTQPTRELILQKAVSVNLETVCKSIVTANQTVEDKLISGTYCHPLLIPHIACWCSPAFAIKVAKVINHQIVEEWKLKLESAQDAYIRLLQQQNASLQAKQDEIDLKKEIICQKQDEIDLKKEIICQKVNEHRTWSNTHAFALLRVHDPNFLPYYVIRCKLSNMSTAISKLRRRRHPQCEILYLQNKVPNAINLFERLKKNNFVKTKRNYCMILDNNHQKLIDYISTLCGCDEASTS